MTDDTPTRTPRTGRRPGTSSSREDILRAARKLFAERGYEDATMRAIAAEAGVDAALVVHFFGNKATLLADGRREVGRKIVALVVGTWDESGTRHPILTLLRAASTEPKAADMLAAFLRARLFVPLMERLGADQPELRTSLAASQLVGLGFARHVLHMEPLASARPDDVVDWYGPTLQRYLTGKLA